jgi:hypothetical protein
MGGEQDADNEDDAGGITKEREETARRLAANYFYFPWPRVALSITRPGGEWGESLERRYPKEETEQLSRIAPSC